MRSHVYSLMDMPSPILIDILSRLPPIDIIRGRYIWKTWNHLASDPEFVNLHFTKSPIYFLVNNMSSNPPDSSYFTKFNFLVNNMSSSPPDRALVEIIGLINGFVCICESIRPRNSVYIWNPILRECITFQAPEFPESSDFNLPTYGFGLSSKRGVYKVIRISQALGNGCWDKTECHVYTLGTGGSWRSIDSAIFHGFNREDAVFIEGNLHWLMEFGSDVLYYFDLDKEILEPFPYPPSLNKVYRKATLNLYNGCLCVCDNTEEFIVKVWVMPEYGVMNSWSKLFEITGDPVRNYFDRCYFVLVFNDGEILILLGKIVMFFRLPDGEMFDEVDARELIRARETGITYQEHHNGPTFEAVQFVPSFISLRNLGEHVVKVL